MMPQVNAAMLALAVIDHMVPLTFGVVCINDAAGRFVADWNGDPVVVSALREARAPEGCLILASARTA
jgi:hypothetical protein|tara:strand:+ start:16447 stop:16650 length:204 start_codon:yes stop_codon:yes gene_type:complete